MYSISLFKPLLYHKNSKAYNITLIFEKQACFSTPYTAASSQCIPSADIAKASHIL